MRNVKRKTLLFSVTLLLLPLVLLANPAATTTAYTRSIYFEVGGSGGAYSFNYGKAVFIKGPWQVNANVGFAVMPVLLYDHYTVYPLLPLSITALYGSQHHFLKLGLASTVYLGYTYHSPTVSEYSNGGSAPVPTYKKQGRAGIFPIVGYHYLFNSKYFAHITFSPLVYDQKFTFFPWGGIGVGLKF